MTGRRLWTRVEHASRRHGARVHRSAGGTSALAARAAGSAGAQAHTALTASGSRGTGGQAALAHGLHECVLI